MSGGTWPAAGPSYSDSGHHVYPVPKRVYVSLRDDPRRHGSPAPTRRVFMKDFVAVIAASIVVILLLDDSDPRGSYARGTPRAGQRRQPQRR